MHFINQTPITKFLNSVGLQVTDEMVMVVFIVIVVLIFLMIFNVIPNPMPNNLLGGGSAKKVEKINNLDQL